MSVTVTILGSSGTYASVGNACSGYLVEFDGYRVVLDCGPGTLANLQRHIDPTEIDALVLTHCHPDHWLELPVLRNALKYCLGHEGLAVYGTEETLSMAEVVCHHELAPTLLCEVIADGEDLVLGPFRMRTSRTQHPPETLAVRLDAGGESVAYSADTGAGWSFAELGAGIDLALCDATALDTERDRVVGLHLTAAQAGEMARTSGVGQLVISHLLPGGDPVEYQDEAAAAYGAPVHVALPGATFGPSLGASTRAPSTDESR